MDQGRLIPQADGKPGQTLAALAGLLKPEVNPAPQLAAVSACLDHSEPPVRLLAALVLGRIGADAVPALARALLPAQPTIVRMAAALGLASQGPLAAGAVRELCRCLTAPEESLRNAACVALGKIGAPAVAALELMLRFPDPNTLSAAVAALTMIGTPALQTAGSLEALAASAPLPLHLACSAALARVTGDPARALPVLIATLSSPDPEARQLSLERMGELQESGALAIPHLLPMLSDPEASVRAAAALSIARVRVPAAQCLAPLARLLEDPAAEVRVYAAIALSALGAEAASVLPRLEAHQQDSDAKAAAAAGAAAAAIQKAR